MGREAKCVCRWNDLVTEVHALLESPELILRGGIRRKIPHGEIKNIRVEGEMLRFHFAKDEVSLALGGRLATQWAKLLVTPPPSLAKKLGITSETVVRLIGTVDDEGLQTALSEARTVSPRKGDLIVARVNTPRDLQLALSRSADQLEERVPLWFIYRKGPGHALNESLVRSTALAAGIVDTKVAAVSPVLTALRFVKRKR